HRAAYYQLVVWCNDACRASAEHFLARLCVCIDGGSIDLLVHLGWSIQSL
ncbi:bacterial export s, 1 family protein, partial [Vibrio parahaemolyticus AQ3810]